MKTPSLGFPGFLLFTAFLSTLSAKAAVFGVDDRVLITPSSSTYALSRSTAVAVLNALIEEQPNGTYSIATDSLEGMLCRDEKFADKQSLPYACSGFLVAPDLLVTAGHCMVNQGETRNEKAMYCEAYSSWVFDYMMDDQGRVKNQNIPADNHYRCKQIVYAVYESQAPFRDFAIVQLDRPVKGRSPWKLAENTAAANDILRMIGHPMGLPSVLSKNARVLENDPKSQYVRTNLDAFDGNSGSVVFNTKNEVVGLLVEGTPASWVKDPKLGCERLNKCDEKGYNCIEPWTDPARPQASSSIQRIAPVIEEILAFEKTRSP
ncbi:MAG: trypsin-like peptidase domain-containing protein [Bdellovibrionaceae bacterium]|nr:trypsin-like peptidase domain-containing protein [Pseudobdellovibrionaceae bacterium]